MSINVIPEVKMKFTKKDLATLIKMMGINQNLAVNILNSIPTGISITTDILCREIRHNRTAAGFLRIEPWESLSYSDTKQLPVRIFYKGKELTPEKMPIQRSAWNGEEVQDLEIEFIWDDGVRKTSVTNSSPLFDDSGSIIGAVATFEDITERRKLETELREHHDHLEMLVKERTRELEEVNEQLRQEIEQRKKSEQILEAFFKHSLTSVVIMDKDFKFIRVNDVYAKACGRSATDFPGHNHFEFYTSDAKEIFEKVVRIKKPYEISARPFSFPDHPEWGVTYWDWTLIPILDSKGEVDLLVFTLSDVTDHIRNKEELEKSSLRITNILNSITDAFYTLDRGWRFSFVNEKEEHYIREVTGKKRDEILGGNIWELFPKLIGTRTHEEFHRAASDQVTVHFEELSHYLNMWLEFIIYPSKDGLSVYCRDITKRKKAEEALLLSEERFYKTFESSSLYMTIYSLDNNKYIEANSNFIRRYGASREEIIGRSLSDLNIWADHKELNEFSEEIERSGFVDNQEIKLRTKTGDIFNALISGVITQLNGDRCVISSASDITELRYFQKEMARLDRLNLIGEMAAGIGHEVRNPMTTVKGFLQLYRDKKDFEKYKETFDLMVEELDRANSIITEFLSLAKNKSIDLKLKNLNKILKSLLPLIEADGLVTDKYINLETQKIPDLLLDEKEIRQLVLNLVRNGLEAMSPSGIINIKTISEDGEVVLSVQDNGQGINPAVLEKLGTPFFTTKESGTGLGMSVCYSIAARHSAKIDIETGSEGTTFFVRFKKPV